MSQLLTELAPARGDADSSGLAYWIDRAADVLKTILPQIPDDHELHGQVTELLTELGADYFVDTPESPVERALADEDGNPIGPEESEEAPVGESLEERFAYALAALRIFVEHSTATGETQNAMIDYIEKTNELLPGDQVAAAAEWAGNFEKAAWPA